MQYLVPDALNFTAFILYNVNFLTHRLFVLAAAIGILIGLRLLLNKARIGLIIRAALSHP